MREILISDLYRDVLGPRNGPYETMDAHHNPLNEYITGVLGPRISRRIGPEVERNPDSEAEIPVISGDEDDAILPDDDEGEDMYIFAGQESFLNPLALPRSMGISFCIRKDGESAPAIGLCVTWARYLRSERKGPWVRKPRAFVWDNISITERHVLSIMLNERGDRCRSGEPAEISIHIMARKIASDTYHISIYLVNELQASGPDERRDVSLHIFQPQIRVRCERGRVVPLRKHIPRNEEERILEFIYRRRAVLARGHMCSAIWRSIDPENIPADLRERFHISCAPFVWTDGEVVERKYGRNIREKFTSSDIRSEFVPVIAIEAPSYDWDSRWGPEPELHASRLAELWNPDEMRRVLEPLVNGYERWIDSLQESAHDLPENDRRIAERIVERCRTVLNRLSEGINVLTNDPDVRLAFCFANKAMYLQYFWRTQKELKWKPFQLAFLLLAVESLGRENSGSRNICDILFVPTGAGKTEAYLAVAAFTTALRRRRALNGLRSNPSGAGTCVIMRYTLRLLTIQQFRRVLRMITACEYLRVLGLGTGLPVGWRPTQCPLQDDFIWGTVRFSVGLWVGGGVTPNRLRDTHVGGRRIPGAIDILKNPSGYQRHGEPAQVIECPACGSILAIPNTGIPPEGDSITLHLTVRADGSSVSVNTVRNAVLTGLHNLPSELRNLNPSLQNVHSLPGDFFTISIEIRPTHDLHPEEVEKLWDIIKYYLERYNVSLRCIHPSRPGYFSVRNDMNFAIYCPNPICPLNSNVMWAEGWPSLGETYIPNRGRNVRAPDGMNFEEVPDFARSSESPCLGYRIPVPALTVDEQIYTHPPSFLIGTVDKIARIAFEPLCASIFGNVDRFHPYVGYYRNGVLPPSCSRNPNIRSGYVSVQPFHPPELIIQDELHLIEGPLGSMVGVYETAVEFLCSERGKAPKYVASSATVKGASEHVRAVFIRDVLQFPPSGLDADDRFFMRWNPDAHPLREDRPGRVYMGVCSPGRGSLTPVRNIWARLLQSSYELAIQNGQRADPYWTLVGYFNAIRELAGTRALYRQDIPERIGFIGGRNARHISVLGAIELSSRVRSTELPVLLRKVERELHGTPSSSGFTGVPDAVFTTSMFGTGVDVPRLGLMVVHGQPKTTAAYIQSTGRVGRRWGGLVVTFYRATRPRDMSHYEMFCGYHLNMERFVEPITASPFAPGTLQRCAGPVAVGILRNMHGTQNPWHSNAVLMGSSAARQCNEVRNIPLIFESRAQQQPHARRPPSGYVENILESALDDWRRVAQRYSRITYVEYCRTLRPVVLGDAQHQHRGIPVVYRNTPQSLRDIEETTCFET